MVLAFLEGFPAVSAGAFWLFKDKQNDFPVHHPNENDVPE
jgi:hypothetical protein